MPKGIPKNGINKGWIKKGSKMSLNTRLKMSKNRNGKKHSKLTKDKIRGKLILYKKGRIREKSSGWKGGICDNKEYVSWLKNKRNRIIKRLKVDGLSHTYGEWELLKKQYGYICPCCRKSEPEINLTEDHIIPLSKGGSDLIENIQPLCLSCNIKKHTKIIKY